MHCFLVERNLPRMTDASLVALRRALREATRRVSTPEAPVRYLASMYLPSTDTCLCLFEASSAQLVRAANATAQAPVRTILEAVVMRANENEGESQ